MNNPLTRIQDFREQLEVVGLTTEFLLGIGLIAFVVFIFSAREVLSWYLKISQVQRQLKDLRQEVQELKQLLQTSRAEDRLAERSPAEGPTFRLDH